MHKFLLIFSLSFFCFYGAAQCPLDSAEVEILILPDNYPSETSWELWDNNSNLLASGGSSGTTLCVSLNTCLIFTIYDSYGDGICCGFGNGVYKVFMDGLEIASGGQFTYEESTFINCPAGFSCFSATDVILGSYDALNGNFWYTFTPDSTGIYSISTCDSNSCDTEIWVYNECDIQIVSEDNTGTIYYDDNDGGCGQFAQITANLEGGFEYWIRIGDADDACDGSDINWMLEYIGPVVGCTDILSCNYEPLATVDDGSCIPFGDPDCPDGPDLMVVQSAIESSLTLDQITVGETDCYIAEGCLNGFGTRDILRFTTHIKNVGTTDYYIGNPTTYPDQFDLTNCHNHAHYKGYAEYVLYDTLGTLIPIGFKNGFCVIDLECSGGGSFQYGCSNMGITAGCGDIYGSGLSCQWIDITDVDDGIYTMVVRTNWDQDPDALGRYELGYENNWAQVCIDIDRTNGLVVDMLEDCPQFEDCLGVPLGNAQPDCTGECNGITLMGDLTGNSIQDDADANQYVSEIIGNDIIPGACNDLDQDDLITVTDAALMAKCNYYNVAHQHPDSSGIHDECNFPRPHIVNPFHNVYFTISDLNLTDNYLDISIKNPNNRIIGYEFNMSGIQISNVINLVDDGSYPISPAYAFGGNKVIGLSYIDSSIVKQLDFEPLLRIYFLPDTDALICIDSIIDVVDEQYHNTVNFIENGCVVVSSLGEPIKDMSVLVHPNPFTESTIISFKNEFAEEITIKLFDIAGRCLNTFNIRTDFLELEKGGLPGGVYTYTVNKGEGTVMGKIVIQ